MIYGLTGGIGSGKSTVARYLAEYGAQVIDADAISHEVTEKGEPLLAELAEAFGADILDEDGCLKRRLLAQRAFSDPERNRVLNELTWRAIRRRFDERIAAADPERPIVLDVPLLFESDMHKMTDENWVVYVPEEERIRRVTERDGITEEEVRRRIAAQMSDEERNRMADVVIDNSKGREELHDAVEALAKEKFKLHGRHEEETGGNGKSESSGQKVRKTHKRRKRRDQKKDR